jgi:Tol biopolymer transport system component
VLAVGLDESNFTLQTIDAAGSEEPQAVTTGKNRQDGGGIAWTPDGRIVYDAIDVGGLGVGIIGANGVGAQKLFQIPTAGPEVSPDGRFLTYIALQNGIHVWKANLDGTNPIQLTKGIGEGDSHWSGDGTRIAFRAWDASAEKTLIHVISFEDGKPIATLDYEFNNHQWSPDGRSLVYSYEDNGVVNLWSRPIDGGPARQLTHFKEGLINGFAFSRDGKRIAMGRGQISSDVVLITDFR